MTYPDPHPQRCICGGTYRYSEQRIESIAEAVKARPTAPKIMAAWVPITVHEYRCTDSPTPGPGENPPRPQGCGRGAKIIRDSKGHPINFLAPLALELMPPGPPRRD